MKILLTRDSQLFPYHVAFGSTTVFSPTVELDAPFTVNEIEPVSSVACTCFTVDKIKSAETGKDYDHTWLWTQMVNAGKGTRFGASPKDAFALAVKGQKVIPTGEIDTSAAYFRCDVGVSDAFTNVKSAIQLEYNKGLKRPVGVGTNWYVEYNNTFPNGVLNMGVEVNSEHEWVIVGWDSAHPDMFKIDAHQGYYLYIPRDVFNHAMSDTYGAVALTLAETTAEQIAILKTIQVSVVQKYMDIIYNLYQQLSATIAQLYGTIFKN